MTTHTQQMARVDGCPCCVANLDAEASIQSMYPDRDDDDIANALAVANAFLGEG